MCSLTRRSCHWPGRGQTMGSRAQNGVVSGVGSRKGENDKANTEILILEESDSGLHGSFFGTIFATFL